MSFQPGQSGNPAGKPRGARTKTTMAALALLDGEAQTLTRKCIELAKAGDLTALRMCMDRIVPRRHGRPVRFDIPPIAALADLPNAIAAVLHRVADGTLSPEEGGQIGHLINAYRASLMPLGDVLPPPAQALEIRIIGGLRGVVDVPAEPATNGQGNGLDPA